MEYNVAQLLKAPLGTVRHYDVDETLPTIDEYPTTEPVDGHVKLTRTKRGILVEANLATAVELQCSRCLASMVTPLRIRVREEFLPTVDVSTGLPVEKPEDVDEAFAIDEHHILDLGEAIRQYGLLAVPLKPLCRAECAGLCPSCGQNLTQGRCACPAEPQDERLASLARLLDKTESEE